MAFLLDTNIAIAIGDQRPGIPARLAMLDDTMFLSIITVVELQGGITTDQPRAAERQAALSAMTDTLDVLPLTSPMADVYAAIIRRIGFSRSRILDRLIAATALVHDLTVITTNGPDFASIPGLKLEVWPRPAQ
ncbi:PIN domain-containing protein [Sphingomonas bacterium]|uniref:PIN domain-containing protein n=1 Tax=Sphingomonas bacterium TaxID=1895847 RepID=UPI001576EA14|nr:PIN domain-containing protein [Sphingomonas bacterium]